MPPATIARPAAARPPPRATRDESEDVWGVSGLFPVDRAFWPPFPPLRATVGVAVGGSWASAGARGVVVATEEGVEPELDVIIDVDVAIEVLVATEVAVAREL